MTSFDSYVCLLDGTFRIVPMRPHYGSESEIHSTLFRGGKSSRISNWWFTTTKSTKSTRGQLRVFCELFFITPGCGSGRILGLGPHRQAMSEHESSASLVRTRRCSGSIKPIKPLLFSLVLDNVGYIYILYIYIYLYTHYQASHVFCPCTSTHGDMRMNMCILYICV